MHASWRYLGSVLIISLSAALAGCTSSPTPEATPCDRACRALAVALFRSEAGRAGPSRTAHIRSGRRSRPGGLACRLARGADRHDTRLPGGVPARRLGGDNLSDGCEGSRYHRFGSLDGLDLTLDDRTLSDQFLAQILEMPVAEVTDGGSDVSFPWSGGGR